MHIHIPLTAATTIVGAIVMAYAWIYLQLQIADPRKSIQQPVRYMQKFFLYSTLFYAIMSIPYLWTNNSVRFSEAAAWAYVVAHIFIYLGLMYISRMTFALIPRLTTYMKPLTYAWAFANILVTAVNAKTMIWGVQPTYDYKLHLTEFNASPLVGIPLGVMAVFAFMPAIILFIISAVKARGINRVKPILIAAGFIIITIAGPMHDNATSAQLYAFADIFNTIGMIIMLFGIAFHIQVDLTVARSRRSNIHAPSNTV